MSFSSIGTYACSRLDAKLTDYYGRNQPFFRSLGSTALIRWLLSPQNTAGFTQIADGITRTVPGKKRAVAYSIDNPYCFDVCALNGVTCETVRGAISNPTQELVFTFDGPAYMVCDSEGNPLRLEFTRADLAKYCTETDTSYITRHIAAFNRRYIQALNKRIGELLEGLVGTNALGQSVTSIPFFLDVTTASGLKMLNPDAFWWLNKQYDDMRSEGQYALVGGAVLKKIAQYQKWASLNDAGIDLSKIDDLNPYIYYDRDLDLTLGQNQFFLLTPGAVQLVPFVENIGENNREVTDLYTHSTTVDQGTGLEFDFEWYFEPKCKVWTYEPKIQLQLAVARPGGCGNGLETVNGVILVEDCTSGAAAPVCPDES